MLHSKILFITGVEVFIVAFFVSYFNIEIPVPQIWPDRGHGAADDSGSVPAGSEAPTGKEKRRRKGGSGSKKSKRDGTDDLEDALADLSDDDDEPELLLLTSRELARYDGSKRSKGLYLSILGKIYDVKKGSKHYGPRGGYHFFAGKDATRAFVTGDFTDSGVADSIDGLSNQDMLGIEEWISFYDKQYPFVGYLQGTYYDANGLPTRKHRAAMEALEVAHKWKEDQSSEVARFPPCNSEWAQNKGGRVWCTNKSGGISRDWVGVPRKLFQPGSSHSRCACIKNSGPPQDVDPAAPHKNRGDLDHPNLQEYPDCNPEAISCAMPADNS